MEELSNKDLDMLLDKLIERTSNKNTEEVKPKKVGFFKSLFSKKNIKKGIDVTNDIVSEVSETYDGIMTKIDKELDIIVEKSNILEREQELSKNFNELLFINSLLKKAICIKHKDTLRKGSFILGNTYIDETWESEYEYFRIIKRTFEDREEFILKIEHIDTRDMWLREQINVERIYNIISGKKQLKLEETCKK